MFASNNFMFHHEASDIYTIYAEHARGLQRNIAKMASMTIYNNALGTKLVHSLSEYLQRRMSEYRFFCRDNLRTISERNNYIVALVKCIETNDVKGQLDMLNDKKIVRFKGFFSRRLYDMLVAYRNELCPTSSNERNDICLTRLRAQKS